MAKIKYVKNSQQQCIAGIVAVPVELDKFKFILYVMWEYEHAAMQCRFKGYKNYVETIDELSISQVMNYGRKMTEEEYELYFPSVLKAFHQ